VAARLKGAYPDPNLPTVLYNAMIAPFTQGPMALSSITWFQGESDLIDNFNSYAASYSPLGSILPISTYACQQRALIEDWREALGSPDAFFGFVTLEPWFYPPPGTPGPLVEFRLAQLAALSLPKVGYASGVDIGDSTGPFGSIHPRNKREVGRRLANAALALAYGQSSVPWRGPTYKSVSFAKGPSSFKLTLELSNVPTTLALLTTPIPGATPFCQGEGRGGGIVAPDPSQCAWFSAFDDAGRVYNMTFGLTPDGRGLELEAPGSPSAILATSFGWGTWPVNAVYSAEGLPLEPWWCNSENRCAYDLSRVLPSSVPRQ